MRRFDSAKVLAYLSLILSVFSTHQGLISEETQRELNKRKANYTNRPETIIEQKEEILRDINHHAIKKEIEENSIMVKDLKKYVDDLISGKGSLSNYDDENSLRVLDQFQEFLSSLTIDQKIAVTHILAAIAMLSSIFTIAMIIYGDYLIIRLKLEEKFPKLARFIKIRRKLQLYSISMNLFLMTLALLAVIYINYLILIYR
jgi:hypothetical protein